MYLIRKHYLIFTDAGKPIYTRYGDENTLAPFFATLSAIIPKIQSYFWDQEQDASKNHNQVHSISAGQFKCYMLKKGSLIYMCLVNMQKKCHIGSYFIDDLEKMPTGHRSDKTKHILVQELMPYPIKDTFSYIRLQLEYLHLQLISLVTNASLLELRMRPNLDLKTSIYLERTLDMMCEVSQSSPAIFLESYPVLRMPIAARKVFQQAVKKFKRPSKLAFGMLVTKLNVINIFADLYDQVKPHDINILFNYIWSVTQMHEGEAWTPVCLPGCSEEFMLHVYTYFQNENLGMILVCTEHEAEYFLECNEYKTEVFEWLQANQMISKKQSIFDLVNQQTIIMHQVIEMKEVQCALICNNAKQQYTQFNFPIVAKTNHRYQMYLRVFQQMKASYHELVNRTAGQLKLSEEETVRLLALQRCGSTADAKKCSTPFEIISKQTRYDFTLAMINYNTKNTTVQVIQKPTPTAIDQNADTTITPVEILQEKKVFPPGVYHDLTLFVVYDQRCGVSLEDISTNLITKALDDSTFITMG